jgi:PAS domain-containing protein
MHSLQDGIIVATRTKSDDRSSSVRIDVEAPIIDEQAKLVFCNAAVENITGLKIDEKKKKPEDKKSLSYLEAN